MVSQKDQQLLQINKDFALKNVDLQNSLSINVQLHRQVGELKEKVNEQE